MINSQAVNEKTDIKILNPKLLQKQHLHNICHQHTNEKVNADL